jgi:putative tricarboxylic transport membrane protein
MKKDDQVSSLAWLVFAGLICIASLRLPLGSLHEPGAAVFPLGSGFLLGILSVIAYLQARRNPAKEVSNSSNSKRMRKNPVFVLVALFGAALCLDVLGFRLTIFLFLVFLLRVIGNQNWLLTLGGSFLASLTSYLLFESWLKVQLPKGLFGF